MNIHGCQLHPKVAIYVVKQLKNDSFRYGLYIQYIYLLLLIRKSRKAFEDVEAEICVDVFKGKIPSIN